MIKTQLASFILFFCLATTLTAQKVTVAASQSEKVREETVAGFATELDGKKDEINSLWIKFLKDIGKVKQSSEPVTITDPAFNGLLFSKGIIYTFIKERGEKTYLWLGIISSEWESSNVDRINHELEKTLYQFGVKYYRDKIQVQIDEAQQAFDAVEKQKVRTTQSTKDLTIQLSNNEREKVQLEKSLEMNSLEHSVLKVKIENNKKAQDSLSQASGQIQKVKLMHQERQRKVN